MKKKLTRLWPLLILSATSACVHASTAPAVVSDYCRIAKPISYDSAGDTRDTIAEIEAHNSKYVCICEGDCPVGAKTGVN